MELYCKLDLHKYHPEIEDYFMCAAFEAVDRLVEVHVISGSVTIIKLTLEGLHIYLKTLVKNCT